MSRRASVLSTGAVLVLAVTSSSGCAADSASQAAAIPASLQTVAYTACLDRNDLAPYSVAIGGDGGADSWLDIGPGHEVPSAWHLHVTPGSITIQRDDARAPIPTAAELERMDGIASELIGCISRYRYQQPWDFPSSRSALLQLYRYDVGVLWPCLAQHGARLGAVPSREAFLTQLSAYRAYPEPAVVTDRDVERLLAAAAACPAVPDYLRGR